MLGKRRRRSFRNRGHGKIFSERKNNRNGNPVRASIAHSTISQSEGKKFFSLDERKKRYWCGGSLGAKSINEAIDKHRRLLNGACN